MNSLALKSPAKINLYLEVLRKRKDGFHEIETVFERINLFDDIILTKINKGIRVISRESIPLNRQNLAYRAAEAFLQEFKLPWGVRITIKKRIPAGSGLGGASSNAASVLIGLNRLFGLSLKKEKLYPLAEAIGADINFFLCEYARALGKGRGEVLTCQKVKKRLHYILVCPHLEVKTKDVYKSLRLGLTKRRLDVKILTNALGNRDLNLLSRILFNRLEEVVLPHAKVIVRIKEALNSLGIRAVLMSGSGSSVFGIVKRREEAEFFAQKMKEKQKGWRIFAVETLLTRNNN